MYCITPVFIDLDGTLWDHEDASQLNPPFKKIGHCIIDRVGERLCLYKDALYFLQKIHGYTIVSTLSWNKYTIAKDVLENLGVIKYFDYLFMEYTPYKSLVLEKAIKIISTCFNCINKIVYIDDRLVHYKELMEVFGERLYYIHMWSDTRSFHDLARIVQKIIFSKETR